MKSPQSKSLISADSLSRRRRAGPVAAVEQSLDPVALEDRLRSTVRGEVRFDAQSRGLYAQDASNYFHEPIGVVIPKSATDVLATLEACRKLGAPIVARGGGTALAGQTCN